MRILYFSFVELDIPNACQTHTLGVLKGFSQNSCYVDAIVPRPLKIRPSIPSVRFYYLWPWQFSNIGKMWVKLLSAFYMLFLCLRHKYDAIYVREMETNPVPRLVSSLFSIPLYIEVNDLIVPTLSASGTASYLIRRVRKHQESDLKKSTGIIIPSVQRRNWLINEYRIPKDRVHLLLNGTEVVYENILDSVSAKKRLGLSPKSFCLGFVGTIYERYDFDSILKAILKCQDIIPEIFLVIIGDGPSKPQIAELAFKLGLEKKIVFTGYVDSDKLGEIIPALDLGLMILTKKYVDSAGPVHTKLSTYALFNLPIIAAGNTLKGYPKEICEGLYMVHPENPCSIADKVIHIYKNPIESSKKANVLHDYAVKKLTWNAATKEIVKIIENDKKLVKNYI